MIEVERLTKRYGERTAVQGVDFRVERGEIVGFLGPNGAGKSTTLRMMTGYLAPTSGRVAIGGVDVAARPREARRLLGYMPEGVPLYPEMRVREYLRHRAILKEVARRDVAGRVDAALEQAGVAHVRDQLIGTLSKGYRQRVGLADALVADPPVLVLDEPTAGLDPNQIRDVRELVRGFAGRKTVILSTHILPEVEATCSRVVIVHRGRVVGEGPPEGLRARAAGGLEVRIEGRGDAQRYREALAGVPGVGGVTVDEGAPEGLARLRVDGAAGGADDLAERVFRAVADAGLALRELRSAGGSLEEVFARLTTRTPTAGDAAAEGGAGDGDDAAGDGATDGAAGEDAPSREEAP